jgi:hypothetical protein
MDDMHVPQLVIEGSGHRAAHDFFCESAGT